MNIIKLQARIEKAIEKDESILVSLQDISKAVPHTSEYMVHLGFSEYDLKYMESHGLAKRGYQIVTKGKQKVTKVVWTLIA